MRREIIGYGSDDEEAFAAEVELDAGRIGQLRSLLEAGDDTDLVNVYQLEGESLRLVGDWLETNLNPGLDYFLESSV
ncbi:MAG TPA: hypothetical protein DGT23_15910 [Micromonosporaceae bacterium]|nr:hypothetical protein [Micromonosporaceae bacterium]